MKMEIITLSEMEISYHGGGGYKSKHNIQLVFTSESFQLFMTFAVICQRLNAFFKTLLQPAEWKPWSHSLFQKVLSTCEVFREMVESVCFLVSSSEGFFSCNPRIDRSLSAFQPAFNFVAAPILSSDCSVALQDGRIFQNPSSSLHSFQIVLVDPRVLVWT